MKLIQMQYFQSVCQYNSVSRAAEELHVSQPTISSAIRELEEEFGVQLFHRVKKRLILTQEGEHFLKKAGEILNMTVDLCQDMNSLGSQNNTIRLGVPPMIGTFLFPSMFKIFKPMYPEINLDIMEHGSRHTIELVEDESLDMAIVITNNLDTSRFNVIDILETQIVLCVSRTHPWAGLSHIGLESLDHEPLILLKEDSYQNAVLKQNFAAKKVQPNIIMYSNQLLTMEKFIENDIASALLFQDLVQDHTRIRGIPLSDPIYIHIGLIWKKGKNMHSSTSKFIEFTQSHHKDGSFK